MAPKAFGAGYIDTQSNGVRSGAQRRRSLLGRHQSGEPPTLAKVRGTIPAQLGAGPDRLASMPNPVPGCERESRWTAPDQEHEQLRLQVQQMLDRGRAAWPTVVIAPGGFAVHLEMLARKQTEGPVAALLKLNAADLYLAFGCACGVAEALEQFNARYLDGLGQLVRGVGVGRQFVDELRQMVRDRLFVGDARGEGKKILSYSGRGSLRSWLAVVAQRMALDALREASRDVDVTPDESASSFGEPEVTYLRSRYGLEFSRSLTESLGDLSERDRLILRLNIVGGVSLERIAVMYQVNQSTVSRWAQAARESVRGNFQRLVAERLGLDPDETASTIQILHGDLDIDLSPILGTDGGADDRVPIDLAKASEQLS